MDLFEINRGIIKSVLKIDDEALNMLAFESSRLKVVSKIGKHPFIYHALLAIITNLLYPLKGLKRKIEVTEDDFVLISCPDPIFRTKTIGQIAGDLRYRIIYLPNFHITTAFHYHKYFEKNKIKAYFPTIRLGQVLSSWRKIQQIEKNINVRDAEKKELRKMMSVLSSFAIYDQVAKEYIRRMDSYNGKWILEHDKFYFMASVVNIHQLGKKCTLLQHGIFFEPSFNYIPLYCDKVLCCSSREKQIYIENGINEESIEVLGAPLQTLNHVDDLSNSSRHYELLVLMTAIEGANIDLIRKVLTYIKQNYSSVLVRMRPRSRKEDEVCLTKELAGMKLSALGTSIEDDISCCDKVVSFSEDANLELVKMNKPFIVVWVRGARDSKEKGKFITEDNYIEEIKKLMTQDFYSTFSREQYKDFLGETDVKVLQKRFVQYINS